MKKRRQVEVYRDDSVLVRVIESATSQCDTSRLGCLAHARLSPIAVIVTDATGSHALDMEGRQVDLDRIELADVAGAS